MDDSDRDSFEGNRSRQPRSVSLTLTHTLTVTPSSHLQMQELGDLTMLSRRTHLVVYMTSPGRHTSRPPQDKPIINTPVRPPQAPLRPPSRPRFPPPSRQPLLRPAGGA